MTTFSINKNNLITHEEMKEYYLGKRQSFNNDLETLFENLQLDVNIDRFQETYFLPKLTEKEQELVTKRNKQYFSSFSSYNFDFNPDIHEQKMKLSKSDSQYMNCECISKTSMMFYNPL